MARRTRIDPPSRAADGFRALDAVAGKDPGRYYVFANPNDVETGVEGYKANGYRVEMNVPDGPRLVAGAGIAEGEAITRKGQMLMSCPMEARLEQAASEEAIARSFDARVLKDGGSDGLRGRHKWGSNDVDRRETEWPSARAGE